MTSEIQMAFRTEIEGHIAVIWLNRPEKANALDRAGWHALQTTFEDVSDQPDVRAIVLAGAGANFCAGIDLSLLRELTRSPEGCAARNAEDLQKTILQLQNTVSAIELCAKPVIAAVHGACYGGGVDIACAADVRLTTADARFRIMEVDMAVIADLGVVQRLPGIIGEGRARELILTGRGFDGRQAAAWGFANESYADRDALLDAAKDIARTIAEKPPIAVRGVKESLNFSRDHSVADGLRHVAMLNAARLRSRNLTEVMSALAEKRPPRLSD